MPLRVDEENGDVLLVSLTGLVSQDSEEDVVVQGSGLSRGDKRRNAKLARLRGLVPADYAIVGIDLADRKQVVVVCDHDLQVLARKTVKARAWELAPVLDWARWVARKRGFADVTVGCEPTGHRWMVLNQLAAQRDMTLVCVNPMLVGRAREVEDYTRDKSDDKDAMLIARLVAGLHCYAPECAEESWARLRQLGARRERLVTETTACIQQLRDLLECAWPGVLEAAAKPFESTNWCAALAVVLDRCDGHPERLARRGLARFEAAVCRELARWGGQRRRRPIIEAVFTALVDPRGVMAQRRGALERASFVLADWRGAKTRLAQVESRMVEVLDELGLAELVTSIPGLSAVGAAAILAETGDLARFDCPRTLVKHAGLCPRDNSSGTFEGRSRISRRGRPRLRLAAWRATWGALHHNSVLAARYRYLTTRDHNKLTDGQARAAIAAALLRWIHVIVTQRVNWDAAIAGAGALPTAA
ncbi:IS110 family transposase [Mycobacterium sp. 663a-19]|uniref:IS110 family transposase n=1 Tax=Mycobacterium sp. 663a-19 TaxID=2986148 RepID=UPI002D1F4475|nr:IS110 family transposase [Mycobacterium sp. 663a-19]MEB3983386.1 IS110 family transposase [Mycobacterium sp. 663a-19]